MIQCYACKHLYQTQRALTMHLNHSRYCMDRYYEAQHNSILPTLAFDFPVMIDYNGNNHITQLEDNVEQEIESININCRSTNDEDSTSESDNNSNLSSGTHSNLYHDQDIIHEI